MYPLIGVIVELAPINSLSYTGDIKCITCVNKESNPLTTQHWIELTAISKGRIDVDPAWIYLKLHIPTNHILHLIVMYNHNQLPVPALYIHDVISSQLYN